MRSGAAILVLLLAACAAAPTQAPGPILLSGPLQGRLAEGVYHDRHDWFSVATPFPPGSVDYRDMLVQEIDQPHLSLVNFIPPTHSGEYYRAYAEDFFASHHPVPGLDTVEDNAVNVYGRQVMAARLEPMVFQQEKPWSAGGSRGLLRFYTEKVSTALLGQDLMRGVALANDYTADILIYVTARNGKVVMLWAEWPEDCSVCRPVRGVPTKAGADAIDRALASDARAAAFLSSFSYAAGASTAQRAP